MLDYKKYTNQWLDSEISKQKSKKESKKEYFKAFVGSRGYLHFDKKISLYEKPQILSLKRKLSSSECLEKWIFFPFLRNDQRIRKFRFKPKPELDIGPRNKENYSYIKSRIIMYASHQDACLFSLINFILEGHYESALKQNDLTENVIAYRHLGSNNVDFAKKAFDYLSSQKKFACILVDIKGFFDNIPHDGLMKSVEFILGNKLDSALSHIMRNLTRFRFAFKSEIIEELKKNNRPYYIKRNKKKGAICSIEDFNQYINNNKLIRKNKKYSGIPQGSPVSGMLANIFMLDFDKKIKEKIAKYKTSLYLRYSDDLMLVCPEEESTEMYQFITDELKKKGLQYSAKKTEIFFVEDMKIKNVTRSIEPSSKSKRNSMQYLGLEWDGDSIVLRPSTIAKRFRPKKNKLSSVYWKYFKSTIKKVKGNRISKQFQNTRKNIKRHSRED